MEKWLKKALSKSIIRIMRLCLHKHGMTPPLWATFTLSQGPNCAGVLCFAVMVDGAGASIVDYDPDDPDRGPLAFKESPT
jgi:hypothetical protein